MPRSRWTCLDCCQNVVQQLSLTMSTETRGIASEPALPDRVNFEMVNVGAVLGVGLMAAVAMSPAATTAASVVRASLLCSQSASYPPSVASSLVRSRM